MTHIEELIERLEKASGPDRENILAELLSEGLDLCERARKLDDQVDTALQAGMGRRYPEGTRCGTPALWASKQYETDLAEWEALAKSALYKMGFIAPSRTALKSRALGEGNG